jgi:class 3 adenylate cyclase
MAFAAKHPKQVRSLSLIGTFANGATLAKRDVHEALVALVRAEWGLGSDAFATIFMPGASPEEHANFQRYQRAAATREGAAAMLEATYATDVSDLLSNITAPTLIMHARGDRAIPFENGRALAGRIAGARFIPIESDRHAPDEEMGAKMAQVYAEFHLEHAPGARPKGKTNAPSGALTVLFTDIASSTSLTQQLGDAQAQGIVRAHNAIVREALNAAGGSEIKHTGDGIMASFPTASAGLECALTIQRGIATREDVQLAVHIGVNAGEPVAEDDDLFGTAVQLARRICDQAGPGEVLVSDVVRQLVAGKGFLFADRGSVALRGFEDPVRLYELRQQDGE